MAKIIFIEDENVWKNESTLLPKLEQAIVNAGIAEQIPTIDVLCRDTASSTNKENIEKDIQVLAKCVKSKRLTDEEKSALMNIAFLLRKLEQD